MKMYKIAQITELSDLMEVIEYIDNPVSLKSALDKTGIQWASHILNKNEVISLNLSNQVYIIDDLDYIDPVEAHEWIDSMSETTLNEYAPYDEPPFWDNVHSGQVLYHATAEENLEEISQNGLTLQNQTRGIANRHTGTAIFTSDNINDTDSYGSVIFEIDLGKMKGEGYMPNANKESPLEENIQKQALAWKLGLENYEPQDYSTEGLYDSTVIFFENIPAKYIKRIQ